MKSNQTILSSMVCIYHVVGSKPAGIHFHCICVYVSISQQQIFSDHHRILLCKSRHTDSYASHYLLILPFTTHGTCISSLPPCFALIKLLSLLYSSLGCVLDWIGWIPLLQEYLYKDNFFFDAFGCSSTCHCITVMLEFLCTFCGLLI